MKMRTTLFASGIAALLLTPAFAETAPPVPRTLTVTGHGEESAAPDESMISAGVVTQARTAAEALSENASAMTRVFAALKDLGVPDKHIQTSGLSVFPQYAPYNAANGNAQKITGYQASNQVSVTIEHIAQTGPAVDALVAAGANQLGGISFTIHDPKPLMAAARASAVEDAAARAKVLAGAAHVALGPILSIEEGAPPVIRPVYAMRAMAEAAPSPPTPVAAGEQTLSADVTIVWNIQ